MKVTIDDFDASQDDDSAPDVEDAKDKKIIRVKDGTSFVEWNKVEGRIVDPFVKKRVQHAGGVKVAQLRTPRRPRDSFSN